MMVTACMRGAGMKVRVCGAELAAGQPADVLEAARSSLLRLRYNGTHRSVCRAALQRPTLPLQQALPIDLTVH